MAKLIVSKDLGKQVSERAAVDHLIKTKITSQKDYLDYMPNDILTRAHIVTFLKNYDNYLNR